MARIAALLLLACAVHAQSVDGTLTDSMSHAPIPDVIVTLLGPSRYNGTTDEAGVFHIGEVKPGKYMLNIVKAGYVLSPGNRASFGVEKDTRLAIEMDPLGRVEGRVRYSDGRPAPRASVWLNAVPSGSNLSAEADLGGRFEFEDVKPGSYVLRAMGAPADPKPEGEIWAATWFPSTTDRASAEPIRVQYGVTATGDVRLRSVPARRLRGVVRDEAGQPAAGASVTLRGGPREQTAVTGGDGVFDFLAHDGDWRVAATRRDGAVELRGGAAVTIARHDVENADVRLAHPFTIPVIIDREDAGRVAPMLLLMPVELGGGSMPAPVRGDLANVYPGRYTIYPMLAPAGSYLESVKLGDIDVTNRTVEIWDGSLPIRVTYRGKPATIRGVVEKGEGAVVLLIDSREYTQRAAAGPDGSFQFGALPPGDYCVLAFENGALTTPAVWRPLLPRAERVHLEKGGVAIVSLKAMPLPR